MLTKLDIFPGQRIRNEIAREIQNYLAKRAQRTVSVDLVPWTFGASEESFELDMWPKPMSEVRRILNLRRSIQTRLQIANEV